MAYKMKGFSGFKSSPAKQKSNMPKDFNMIGSSGSGKKILTKQEKSAKHKQNFDARQASKQQGKEFVENLKKRGDLTPKAETKMATDFNYENKKAQRQTLKKVAKKGGKQILKRLGPVGVAITAYEVGQAIPKVVKAAHGKLKKEAKERSEGKATDQFRGPKY